MDELTKSKEEIEENFEKNLQKLKQERATLLIPIVSNLEEIQKAKLKEEENMKSLKTWIRKSDQLSSWIDARMASARGASLLQELAAESFAEKIRSEKKGSFLNENPEQLN